ncbi:MAG: hypothetical protein ACE5MB_01970 [Anaerolineae bacterium]
MYRQDLDNIAEQLASGYLTEEPETVQREFLEILETVLPTLAERALATQRGGKGSVEEVWKEIRRGAEEDFQAALERVERLKVVYVASKFMNNKAIGTRITEVALALAKQKEGIPHG